VVLQPYDMEVGAGTFHPATTLRALGPKPWRAAYVQPSRRPNGRPLRREPEPAAALLPVPGDPEAEPVQPAGALSRLARRHRHRSLLHDIRFVEDDWESPTLGAWGLGWECLVRRHGVSASSPISSRSAASNALVAGELTYGLERLAMYVQGVDNVYDLNFNGAGMSYGDVFLENEVPFV
jgi:glycyl-tRNA synthetase alpha chain